MIRFKNLDSIRSIAFFSTFLAHAFDTKYEEVKKSLFYNMVISFSEVFSFGVPLFFVLSGFLITYLMFYEFEKNKNELETNIKTTLNQLELSEEQFKQKIEKLKTEIKKELQDYNDKIAELKKRSEIREQRIKKTLTESMKKNDLIIQNLLVQTEENKKVVEEQLYTTKEELLSKETKILSNKERLEMYKYGLDDIIKKFEITKDEIINLEQEIETIEKNVYDKFNDILKTVSTKKQLLVDKLTQLLSAQEKLIIKSSEIKSKQKS
jgi:hypothetical protein